MKRRAIPGCAAALLAAAVLPLARAPSADPLIEGYRLVEVASVADAMEQLYGKRAHMTHPTRPLFPCKFAGPAVTVLMERAEHADGSRASQGMLDAIDSALPGSVSALVLPDGADIAGIGGLMATAMRSRSLAGAVIGGGVRDVPQIRRIQLPVFSTGIVPSTSINRYRFKAANVPVMCGGVEVRPGDIVTADEDGVAVVPRERAADVLRKAQELDDIEHRTYPFIGKFRSIRKAVGKFGRI